MTTQRAKTILAVHGGLAGPRDAMTPEREESVREALRKSLVAGLEVLHSKAGDCVAAVIAAVAVMEDAPHFNAGHGAVFTQKGTIELDAAIMAGQDRNAGAVANVKRIRNPIRAAHAVMLQSPAVFMVGNEADEFAAQAGVHVVDPSYFVTERRWNEFLAWKERRQAAIHVSRGTVGAVALDTQGNLAAATSTGGISFKVPGRVGDSGVLGAGTFADNRSCAVSATGDGELFIRTTAAYSVSARMRYRNLGVAAAAAEAVDDIRGLGGVGGMIALDQNGNLAMPFYADGMYRSAADENGNIAVDLYDE